jgi:hypothetical protein
MIAPFHASPFWAMLIRITRSCIIPQQEIMAHDSKNGDPPTTNFTFPRNKFDLCFLYIVLLYCGGRQLSQAFYENVQKVRKQR